MANTGGLELKNRVNIFLIDFFATPKKGYATDDRCYNDEP